MSKTYLRAFLQTSLDKQTKEGKTREVARLSKQRNTTSITARIKTKAKAEERLFKREVHFINYIMHTSQED